MNTIPAGLPPSIVVSSTDAARLDAMLESPRWSNSPGAQALLAELARAEVIADADMPPDVVGMHASVECVDEANGERRVLTLVYPQEADVDTGRISVLAPVGSALLGLSVGQSIDWPVPGGRTLRLRVTAVHPKSAAAP